MADIEVAEQLRKRDVGAVEITDAHGRRKTIDVADLNEADLALAEQFGYHPVTIDQHHERPQADQNP